MTRVRMEAVLAAALGLLTALTALWPTWIEQVTGTDPDAGSGAVEWALVGLLAVLTVAAVRLARRDLRIARAAH